MKTRLIAILLAVAISVGIFAIPAAAAETRGLIIDNTVAPFTDVFEDDYFADAVRWAHKNGVASGTSSNTFSPQKTVTRREACVFLWRVAGSPAVTPKTNSLGGCEKKTSSNAWYYDAMHWCYNNSVISFSTAKNYPEVELTEKNFSTMLYKLALKWGYNSKTSSSSDKKLTRGKCVNMLYQFAYTEAEKLGLNFKSLNAQQRRLLFYAESALGTEYVYGGTNINSGIDCSHYAAHVLNQSWGMKLPESSCSILASASGVTKVCERGSSQTGSAFFNANKSKLKFGDLMFFENYEKTEKFAHVAICLGKASNGRYIIIHASEPKVQIHYLDASYYGSNDNYYTSRLHLVMRPNP